MPVFCLLADHSSVSFEVDGQKTGMQMKYGMQCKSKRDNKPKKMKCSRGCFLPIGQSIPAYRLRQMGRKWPLVLFAFSGLLLRFTLHSIFNIRPFISSPYTQGPLHANLFAHKLIIPSSMCLFSCKYSTWSIADDLTASSISFRAYFIVITLMGQFFLVLQCQFHTDERFQRLGYRSSSYLLGVLIFK